MLEQKFLGQLNSDDADRDLENAIRDCLNLVPQVNGRGASPRRTTLKGMVSEANTLPVGTNVTIGAFNDKNNDRAFFWNYNSNNNHGVYAKDIQTGDIYTIVESSLLNFTEQTVIAGAGVVGDELVWTDGENPIRSLNIEKAIDSFNDRNVKKWGLVIDTSVIAGLSPIISYTSLVGGNLNINLTTGVDSSTIDTWVSEIDASLYLNAERCGDDITITEATLGDVTSVSATELGVYADNHYILPLTDTELNLANIPPVCEPTASYETDETRKINSLQDKQFQFRVRYVYFDNTKSVLSPISQLYYSQSCSENDLSNNCIALSFNEGTKFTDNQLTLVKNVEIYFREGNLGSWYLAETLSRGEFLNAEYKFYNDGSYGTIDDATSVKNFDSVPLKANTLATLKNRIFLAGTTEGYDTPCVDASVDVDIDDTNVNDATPTWTIEGFLRIINQFYTGETRYEHNENQFIYSEDGGATYSFGGFGEISGVTDYIPDVGGKFNQFIPQGGFTVFLAGTNYRATTTQIFPEGLPTVSTTPLVYDGDSGSKRVDIKNALISTSELAAGSRTIKNKAVSQFSIEGVPPGRYILRVASHKVYEGDSANDWNGAGTDYQINPSNKWQKTSANVYDLGMTEVDPVLHTVTGGVPNAQVENYKTSNINGDFEILLELGDTGGTYTIPTVIGIEDLSNPVTGNSSSASEFYVRDSNGLQSEEGISSSASIEQANFIITDDSEFGFGGVGLTDHNGYGWFARNNLAGGGLQIIRGTITSSIYNVKITTDQTMYEDKNLSSISNGDVTSVSAKSDFNSANGSTEWIITTVNNTVQNNARTKLEGFIRDFDGNPLSGVLVSITNNSRDEVTDSSGRYSILTYSDTLPANSIKTGFLIASTELSNCLIDDFPLGANKKVTLSVPISPGTNNNTTPYEVPAILLTITSLLNRTSHKRGGAYKWGIQYYDEYLRQSFVYTDIDLRKTIPYYTEELSVALPDNGYTDPTYRYGEPIITWEIRSTPPSWATHYRWVRTKNLNYQSYLDWVANDILYLNSTAPDDVTGDLTDTTTYANGDATQIAIGLENLITYQEQNSDSKLGYTFASGDRIILLKNNGSYFEEYIDLKIKGQDGNYIFIEALNSLPELLEGLEFQIYTPKSRTEVDTYYEISPCYKVTNGYHEGGTQDQTALLPAQGTFSTGDTYLISRTVPTDTSLVAKVFDSENINDSVETKDISIGRAGFENINAKQEFFFTTIRFSDELIQDSSINGIKTFEAFNEESLPNERGIIRKLVGTRDNLLAIHETESTSVSIGESMVTSPDGTGFLSQTNRVISDDRLLAGEFGTINPESVVEYNDNIYWYDANKAEPIMYSVNGLDPLGSLRKMRNYFFGNQLVRNEHLLNNPSDYSRVYGGYDPEKKMFLLTFNDMGATEGTTIVYNDDYNFWATRMSFKPSWYVYAITNFFSFKDGVMWKHDVDDNNHNYFYGVHYPISFSLVSNADPFFEKIYRHVGIKSNVPHDIELTNREGQLSDIVKDEMIQRDNVYYVDVLRDKNTPVDTLEAGQVPLLDGEVMRSEVMDFKFDNDDEGQIFVESLTIDYQESPGHNMGMKRG